jgi:hypothetical protein
MDKDHAIMLWQSTCDVFDSLRIVSDLKKMIHDYAKLSKAACKNLSDGPPQGAGIVFLCSLTTPFGTPLRRLFFSYRLTLCVFSRSGPTKICGTGLCPPAPCIGHSGQ